MNPETAVGIECGRPDTEAAEKIIAEHFTCIGRIILEPFAVEFFDSMDFLLVTFLELCEIQLEMAVVPVRGGAVMHLTRVAFRPAPGSVSLEPETCLLYDLLLCPLHITDITFEIFGCIRVLVKFREHLVPLVEGDGQMNLRNIFKIKYITQSFIRYDFPRRIIFIRVFVAGIVLARVFHVRVFIFRERLQITSGKQGQTQNSKQYFFHGIDLIPNHVVNLSHVRARS